MEIIALIILYLAISFTVTLLVCLIEREWELFLQGWLMLFVLTGLLDGAIWIIKAIYKWATYWNAT